LESRTLQSFDPVSHPLGKRILLFAVAALASTILLKIDQIQYLEFINLGLIVVLLVTFAQHGYQATWFRPYLRIASFYTIFVVIALTLAAASLRYDFYLVDDLNILKYPAFISISRALELTGNVTMMLYLANLFRQDVYWLQFTMRVYFWVGVASAVYSMISYPLSVAGIAALGAYSDIHRFRGFYNEGGAYGPYVVTVLLVGVALYRRGWERGPKMFVVFGLLLVALFMAQSKAAYAAIVFCGLINVILAGSFSRRLVMLAGVALIAFFILQTTRTARLIAIYQKDSLLYERYSYLHARDGNFVYGRIAGGFIVPRMIAAHPFTGIGWGNYGNLRNDPQYRGASQFVPESDDPGLGLLGTAADLGLPLITFLVCCIFVPVFYVRRRGVPLYVFNMVLWQPIVHIFGAQLNLTYPWITTALALGLAYSRKQPISSSDRLLADPSPGIEGDS
jgi:hypothetical protein